MSLDHKEKFISELNALRGRKQFFVSITPDYYEPGYMEFMDQYDGEYYPETGKFNMSFEVRGVKYEGRMERIEFLHQGDSVQMVRDLENESNPNRIRVLTLKGKDIGLVPEELSNSMAPLLDEGAISFSDVAIQYVEPISQRNRNAVKPILFVRVNGNFRL